MPLYLTSVLYLSQATWHSRVVGPSKNESDVHERVMERCFAIARLYTFSADDPHWKDLMVVLASCSGRNISNEQVDELSDEERRTLMTSNPVVTAHHFQHHFQSSERNHKGIWKANWRGNGFLLGE